MEALVSVTGTALTHGGGGARSERYQVVVHVDEDAVVGDEAAGALLDEGPAIAARLRGGSPATRRSFAWANERVGR